MRTGRIVRCGWVGSAVLLLTLVIGGTVCADETAEAGRAIADRWAGAMVRVKVVMKVKYGGSAREMKQEGSGIVVDPSGLTVIPFSATNPDESGSEMDGGDGGGGASSEVTDAKIVLSDGKEIPARVVLRDRDLDVSFIRPVRKRSAPMPAVNLKDSASAAVFDEVVLLERFGKIADNRLAVSCGQVVGIIDKPRKVYVLDLADEYGAAVFSIGGKLLGIVLMRSAPPGSDADYSETETPVVVPAADIAAVAARAPQIAPKPSVKSPPAAKPTAPRKPPATKGKKG